MSYVIGLKCLRCGSDYPTEKMFEGCPKCKKGDDIANLFVDYDYDGIADIVSFDFLERRYPNVWKYRELLPVAEEGHMITLGEGHTPLLKSQRLGEKIGLENLYLKDESRNPTWSFKDRLCCVAIAKGLDFHVKVATMSSIGNHGASTAAYAARAGINSVIFTISTALETMLTQMQIYKAKVVPVTTSIGRRMLMSKCVKEFDWYPTGNYTEISATGNPYGVQGHKTIGFEICEQLGRRAPDKILMPTSFCEGFFGTWRGIQEFYQIGLIDSKPKMISVEPTAGGPLWNAVEKGLDYIEKVPLKPSVAMSIAGDFTSYQGLRTVLDSDGLAVQVTDDEIVEAQKMLASLEGVYAELASVATIAGVKKLRSEDKIEKDEEVVCVLTSSGLKDFKISGKYLPAIPSVEPDWDKFISFMKEQYGFRIE